MAAPIFRVFCLVAPQLDAARASGGVLRQHAPHLRTSPLDGIVGSQNPLSRTHTSARMGRRGFRTNEDSNDRFGSYSSGSLSGIDGKEGEA